MRIPFPQHVPLYRAALFAAALAFVERLEGTPLYFCFGVLCFIVIATFAFNLSGGLARAAGAYIFFYAVLVFIIGVTYKAILGEPAQSNLSDPRTTIEAFVASISMLTVAAFLSRRFARKTGLLEQSLKTERMYYSSIGCIVVGTSATTLISFLGESGARLQSAFGQANQFVPLGILIGVMYEIRRSNGTRSINTPVLLAMAWAFVFDGLAGFSKQGIFEPLFCWALPVWVSRYRLSKLQLVGGSVLLFILFHYLVPYAQMGRVFLEENQSVWDRLAIGVPLLEDPEGTRKTYLEASAAAPRGLNNYYNTPQGLWDRLQFVSADDALINITDQGKVFGLLPLYDEMLNAIPHVFWPEKPSYAFGNVYAHEIGGIPDEDTTTGISFSPTGEAYHLAKWKGIFIIAPLLWFTLFTVYDALFGKLTATPWGLLILVMFAHTVPEGGITGIIHGLTVDNEIFVFCALFCVYAAPPLGELLLRPQVRSRRAPMQAPS